MRKAVRRESAKAWLASGKQISVKMYARRYGVDRYTAREDLEAIGFQFAPGDIIHRSAPGAASAAGPRVAARGGACGEVLGVAFPGGSEAFDGELECAGLLGEGEPDVVAVAPVDAGAAARSDGDTMAGGDVSEGVGAVEGELDPQRQPGGGWLGSPGGNMGGEELGEAVAAPGERAAVGGEPVGVDGGQELGGERLGNRRGGQVYRGLVGEDLGSQRFAGADPPDAQPAPEQL